MAREAKRNKPFSDWLRQIAAAPSETFAAELEPGQQVGPFQIVARIGQGGFGIVYEAVEQPINRRVALKIQRRKAGPQEAAAFVREAQLVAALQHSHIVTLYRYGEYKGRAYLVFELLRGATLESAIDRAALDTREALAIAVAVAEGMCYAHDNRVLHRDLKPSNVFICEPHAGDDASIKLLDFGLSRETPAEQELACGGSGTRGFTAPEGATSERSDVFSAGMTLYVSLVAKAAQRLEAPEEMDAALRDAGVNACVRDLILAATAPNPMARPATAEEWLKLLCAARDRVQQELRPKPRFGRASRVLSAGALLLGVAVTGVVTWSKQPQPVAGRAVARSAPSSEVPPSAAPVQSSVIVYALRPELGDSPPPREPSAAPAPQKQLNTTPGYRTVVIPKPERPTIRPARPPSASSIAREGK